MAALMHFQHIFLHLQSDDTASALYMIYMCERISAAKLILIAYI